MSTISDEKLLELHNVLAGRSRSAGEVISRTDEDKRAYNREVKQRSRERQRAALADGYALPTVDAIRTALADAAIMILATGAPGADEVRRVLGKVFSDKPGVLMKIELQVRQGKLRPRLAGRLKKPKFLRTPK